tara:strand:- start:6099 stop:6290 length:192 start_codon:yes stop_codon:yes gene_type:complete
MEKEIKDNLTPQQQVLVDTLIEQIGENSTNTLLGLGFNVGLRIGKEAGMDLGAKHAIEILMER